jgi:hypothetical protein
LESVRLYAIGGYFHQLAQLVSIATCAPARERDFDITDTHREVKRREFLIIILGIKGSCLKLLVELG